MKAHEIWLQPEAETIVEQGVSFSAVIFLLRTYQSNLKLTCPFVCTKILFMCHYKF